MSSLPCGKKCKRKFPGIRILLFQLLFCCVHDRELASKESSESKGWLIQFMLLVLHSEYCVFV